LLEPLLAAGAAQPALFSLTNCLILAGVIFAAGAWGVIARRNLLVMLISIELMLNAVNLAFISFARAHANLAQQTLQPYAGETGQLCALFVIAIAAAEAAVGLAIVIALFRNRQTVDTRELRTLQQ
jgi:NADH-quinone oxidoreductase subunit K